MPDNNPKYFGEFVIGENKLPCAIAECLLEGYLQYNPIYFYGPTASGKTLFLQTLAGKMKELYPEKNIVYYDRDTYVNEFVTALRNGDRSSLYSWKTKNKQADILFFDDFEFMTTGNKKASLQAFFQMFNQLHIQQKQIIIASNLKPKYINLEERYKSRLLMGLPCELFCPGEETRIEILKRKCENMHIVIHPEILMYIAHNVKNAGTLTGAWNRMAALTADERINLSIEQVDTYLEGIIVKKEPITIEQIIKDVGMYFGVTSQEILSKKRNQNVVTARQIAIYIACKVVELPYLEKAKAFHRDHSTIFYAYNCIENKLNLEHDRSIEKAVRFFMEKYTNEHI